MEQSKKISRKVISIVLSLLMVFSCFSGMSLTAWAVDATELTAETTTWENGDYVVPTGGVTISGHITVNGTVNLSLTTGTALTANAGITLSDGATLNVSGKGTMAVNGSNENTSSTVAGNGKLVLNGGTVTVTGGNGGDTIGVRVSSGAGGAAINGAVTVNGGTLTATGGRGGNLGERSAYGTTGAGGAAIGGSVTINAGTVTATGGNGGTIGSMSWGATTGAGGAGIAEAVTINGGKLTTTNGTGGGGQNDGTRGAGGKGYDGTLTLGKGVKLYEGTNDTGTVLDGNDSGRRVYEGEKKASMYAYGPDIAQGPDKTDLNTAITAAQTLYDSIKDDTDYSTIASTLKTAIDAAKEVADSETADQDAIDAAKTAITTAKTNAEAAKKDVDDTNAANAVITKINALPAADDVTTANKEAIEAARAAYNALTDDQKKKVDATVLAKLTNAETALQDAVDTETAGTATETINSLPDADKVTTADKEKIEAARKAYNDLTDDQKKKVSDDTLKKLTDAEDALKAAGVSDTINALPAADEVTTADKDAIEKARKAYDALTYEQKAYVPAETLKKLTDAESALAVAEVNAAIDALPAADEVTTANKEAIAAARKAYDALTDDEKAKIAPETLKKLTDAESALAVATANEAINALPAADEVTTANKDAIEAARKAYDALTDDEKAKIAPETLKKLTDAESAFSVASVKEKINALPAAGEVTTANKDTIEAARAFYDALTDEQKEKITPETLKKLTDAEDALAAATVSDEIKALPAAAEVTTDNKAAIAAARKAYDALTDEQKAYVAPETLKKLTDAESALAVAEANKAISELPEADKVTIADKDKVDAARKAYNALTDEEKAKIAPETLEKLTNAEKAYSAAKEADDTAKAKDASDKIAALPKAADVTTKDEKAIKAARAAYDALSDEQKAKVPAKTVKQLEESEKALAQAKEVAAAKKNAKTAMNNGIGVTQKDKKITVKWSKASKADGYFVYVQYCGKDYKKPVKTVKKNSTTKVTITKINGKKLNLKKNFKVVVKPYKIVNGKKVVLATSISGHIVGVKHKKYTNVKTIKATKKALTVKVGKTVKAKAKITLVDKKKKHIPAGHGAKFRYRTSDKSIATVDKNGKIKGIKKGTCTIYVYAINGKMTKIKVTVK